MAYREIEDKNPNELWHYSRNNRCFQKINWNMNTSAVSCWHISKFSDCLRYFPHYSSSHTLIQKFGMCLDLIRKNRLFLNKEYPLCFKNSSVDNSPYNYLLNILNSVTFFSSGSCPLVQHWHPKMCTVYSCNLCLPVHWFFLQSWLVPALQPFWRNISLSPWLSWGRANFLMKTTRKSGDYETSNLRFLVEYCWGINSLRISLQEKIK